MIARAEFATFVFWIAVGAVILWLSDADPPRPDLCVYTPEREACGR